MTKINLDYLITNLEYIAKPYDRNYRIVESTMYINLEENIIAKIYFPSSEYIKDIRVDIISKTAGTIDTQSFIFNNYIKEDFHPNDQFPDFGITSINDAVGWIEGDIIYPKLPPESFVRRIKNAILRYLGIFMRD